MKSKFKGNFLIALPAALVTLLLVLILSANTAGEKIIGEYNLLQIVPYLLVLVGGVLGLNVFIVLIGGIVCGSIIMMATGEVAAYSLLANMGSGAAGMFETAMVAVLVAALCGLIREAGGFDALLYAIRKVFKGKKGGLIGIGMLVGMMDVATANNTVAIVIANPIAKQMSEDYGISSERTACLLDTFSCIMQGIIPYGAQILVAIAAVTEMGYQISAFEIIPNLFYPYLLLACSLVAILMPHKKK